TGEACNERSPPGEERRRLAERLAQVHIFAARARPQRRELRICHRARERERATRNPCRQEQRRVGDERGNLRRREQDAAADDVGDDDGRGIERTETALECGRARHYWVSS